MTAAKHEQVPSDVRFRFGKNWRRYLRVLNEERIHEAEQGLCRLLGMETLSGLRLLDIGSGSGLHSLAARRLGAVVRSFDNDPDSVACTATLRARCFGDDPYWRVEEGSVLDTEYLASLGRFDIVYAWGVLHHTGDMWQAMANVLPLVDNGGKLFIAIYNDCGSVSRRWLVRKRRYNRLPRVLRPLYFTAVWVPVEIASLAAHVRWRKTRAYFSQWTEYKRNRGMSRLHDMIDWLGGYPYEFADAADIVSFHERHGFKLVKLEENTGYGCHQLVFELLPAVPST